MRTRTAVCCTAILSAVSLSAIAFAETTHFNKAQVGDLIRKVETGVNDFESYLNARGENAQNNAASAKKEAKENGRGGKAKSENKKAAKNQAAQSKDELQNAMDDLNRTTNRLRRKFDATANYLETKVQMEQVMDSARRVNGVVAKGKDGQAGKLWKALRAHINELARTYDIAPMGG